MKPELMKTVLKSSFKSASLCRKNQSVEKKIERGGGACISSYHTSKKVAGMIPAGADS
jgi:hypothetical protein